MPQNTSPIFGLIPELSGVNITTTAAQARSDGLGGAIGTAQFLAFTSGPSGSYVQKVRFMSVATTPTTGVATVLRVTYSTVNTGTPASGQVFLLGEISVGALASANSTNATNFYELPLNFAMPANTYLLVSQHAAQTTNQNWQAFVIGSDY
jgi:hypothetical protein